MEGKMYGYIRVSTKEQNEARQWIAMEKFGIERERIFSDRQSGKDFVRPAYQKMMKTLRSGDTVVVKSIDRLGRNYAEVLEQWRVITKEKEVAVVVLDTPLLDTRQHRDLVGTLISDLILAVFSCVAEMERTFNRQRQAEGIAAAKAKGVHFGRKKMKRPANYEELRRAWAVGKISARKAAASLGVTHRTFLQWARE